MKRHFEYEWCETARRYVQKPEEAVVAPKKKLAAKKKKAVK